MTYCVECKDIDAGRNPIEVSAEMDRLIKGHPKKPMEPSRVAMHLRRIDWVEHNWPQFAAEFELSSGVWTLVPVIVTSEELPSAFMGSSPIPMRSISRLDRDGAACWSELAAAPSVRQMRSGQ